MPSQATRDIAANGGGVTFIEALPIFLLIFCAVGAVALIAPIGRGK